jgi:hypothetical protein
LRGRLDAGRARTGGAPVTFPLVALLGQFVRQRAVALQHLACRLPLFAVARIGDCDEATSGAGAVGIDTTIGATAPDGL